jgi:YD repeat-containing protein
MSQNTEKVTMNTLLNSFMGIGLLLLGLVSTAHAGQVRFYDARGNSLGTAVPYGNGSARYYDARGRSLGTSTTSGGTTRFYNAGGRSLGSERR